MKNRIARVVVNLSLDKVFDYHIPDHLIGKVHVGSRVDVPFNRSERAGFVIGIVARSQYPNLKDVVRIHGERPFISEALLKLGKWMAEYYCCSREQGIQALLPAVVRHGKVGSKVQKVVRLNPDVDHAKAMEELKSHHCKRQIDIMQRLELLHKLSLKELRFSSGGASSAIKALRDKNLIIVDEEEVDRDPFFNVEILPDKPLELTDEQAESLALITEDLEQTDGDRHCILLHGVTGSGKTEVYLQAIAHCLDRGLDAIVLVPEIALTPQTTERFRARFGDLVSVLHSRLSDGERLDEWRKINEDRVRIVVGARSALFAPFRNLGLIVVDEEHETSYKQGAWPPLYQGRDVAVMRGRIENATVILGTATPAVESYHNAKTGKYLLSNLTKRVDDQRMPSMQIIDMCQEKDDAGRAQIISNRLQKEIRATLEKGEQVMLFLNRRGYATQMQCMQCGYVAECEECSVNFTYHRSKDLLLCHICGAVRRAPTTCPDCSDENVRYTGLGTEKVESSIKGLFPYARTLRMDSDTMTKKDSYRKALTAFRAHDVDILIGTQMIAKGLHFPNVTLVGVVFADLSLMIPDFRAGERTFQLLVQVAGRAGRGEVPGLVLIQTYTPYHPALEAAINLDYHRFFAEEMEIREMLNLPPLSHMIKLRMRGENEERVAGTMHQFAEYVRPVLPDFIEMVNPLPCSLARRRGEYYFQIMLTTSRAVIASKMVKHWVSHFPMPKDVKLQIDVDPQSTM